MRAIRAIRGRGSESTFSREGASERERRMFASVPYDTTGTVTHRERFLREMER